MGSWSDMQEQMNESWADWYHRVGKHQEAARVKKFDNIAGELAMRIRALEINLAVINRRVNIAMPDESREVCNATLTRIHHTIGKLKELKESILK